MQRQRCLGVAVAAIALLDFQKKPVKGATYAVQGAGAMGAAVIRYFGEKGAVLKSVSDPKFGGTYIFDTPPKPELVQALATMDNTAAAKRLAETGIKPVKPEEVLYQDVEVLFPCAVQEVIRADNVDKVKAKSVVEGANGPSTQAAREAMHKKGIVVIPDFIANPGGIIAAYVELTSKITPEENAKTRAKVNEAKKITIDRITKNIHILMGLAAENGVDTVTAGRYMAYKNIFEGIK